MRFMILLKGDEHTEAGELPTEAQLTEMGKYNQELVDAGVLRAGEGLQPTSKGARVHFSGDTRTVEEGPFPETGQLLAGFWIFEVSSRDEAVEWVKRCPKPLLGDAEIEIRQVYEADDFGEEFTPELRAREERMRRQSAARD
jgi:hypothetical protein